MYVLSVPSHSYFLFLHKVRVASFEKPQDEEANASDEKDAKGFTRPRNRTTLIESKFLVYWTGLPSKEILCLHAFC